MEINESVALVTGGARGLGAAFVEELLSRGASKVYATSRTPFAHDSARVQTVALDVTDPTAVREFAHRSGDVRLVINNAGYSAQTSVLDEDLAGFRAELETNLFGVLHVARAYSTILAGNGGGAILNIHSVRSWLGNGTGYAVSKAAEWAATNGLRLLLHDQGTLVTGLHVGLMDTDMTRQVVAAKANPRDIARSGLDGIESRQDEVLADDISRWAKSQLASPLSDLFTELRDLPPTE